MPMPKTGTKKCGKVPAPKPSKVTTTVCGQNYKAPLKSGNSHKCPASDDDSSSSKEEIKVKSTWQCKKKKAKWVKVQVEEVEEVEEDHHGIVIQNPYNKEPKEQDTTVGERGNEVDEVLSQFCNIKSWCWPGKQDNIELEDCHHRDFRTISCEKQHHKGFVDNILRPGEGTIQERWEKWDIDRAVVPTLQVRVNHHNAKQNTHNEIVGQTQNSWNGMGWGEHFTQAVIWPVMHMFGIIMSSTQHDASRRKYLWTTMPFPGRFGRKWKKQRKTPKLRSKALLMAHWRDSRDSHVMMCYTP